MKKILILISFIIFFVLAGCESFRVIGPFPGNHHAPIGFNEGTKCPEGSKAKGCRQALLDKNLADNLRAKAKENQLKNLMFVALFDADGEVVLLHPEQLENGDGKPSSVTPKGERGELREITIRPFEGSECLRWLHNVTVGGTYYVDYCKYWKQ